MIPSQALRILSWSMAEISLYLLKTIISFIICIVTQLTLDGCDHIWGSATMCHTILAEQLSTMTMSSAFSKISGTPRSLSRPDLLALRRQLSLSISEGTALSSKTKSGSSYACCFRPIINSQRKCSQCLWLVRLFYILPDSSAHALSWLSYW